MAADLGGGAGQHVEGVGEPVELRAFILGVAGDERRRNLLAARSAFNRVYQTGLDGLRAKIESMLRLIDRELPGAEVP